MTKKRNLRDERSLPEKVVDCLTWDDFIRRIRSSDFHGRVLYRGHREREWKLQSPWDRWYLSPKGSLHDERGGSLTHELSIQRWFLERFRNAAIGLPGLQTSELKEDQLWALGRHHGLITPLLDWTESPYVAAYFAFMDLAEHLCPGFLSGMRPIDKSRDEPIVIWRFWPALSAKYPELEFVQSRADGSHRQRAQQGVFTRLVPPEQDPLEPIDPTYRDLEAYLKSRRMPDTLLVKYRICGREMTTALRDLYHMNIRPATIFPDLSGAAQDANMSHLMIGRHWDYPHPGFEERTR